MNRILVVDDDPHIREVVQFALDKEGFDTLEAGDGAQALERFAADRPDLIVLDITMPELDGTEVCRRIRQTSRTPIIFLSSRDDEIDRVLGLELGGDDYITKPFSPRELVARVKAVLRRLEDAKAPRDEGTAIMQHGRLSLNLDDFTGSWDDTQIVLTLTEFGIIRTLMQRPGKVYSRDDLMSSAYELSRIVSDRTIDSHIKRLRKKFREGDLDELRGAILRMSTAQTPEERVRMAERLEKDGSIRKAITIYEAFLAEFPDHIQAQNVRYRRAICYDYIGKRNDAVAQLKALVLFCQLRDLRKITDHTLTDIDGLRRQMDDARRNGYHVSDRQSQTHNVSTAAPVLRQDGRAVRHLVGLSYAWTDNSRKVWWSRLSQAST